MGSNVINNENKKLKDIIYKVIELAVKNKGIGSVDDPAHRYLFYDMERQYFSFKFYRDIDEILVSGKFINSIKRLVPIDDNIIGDICQDWFDENEDKIRTNTKVDWL